MRSAALLVALALAPALLAPAGAAPGDQPVTCLEDWSETLADLRGAYVRHARSDCRWAVKYVEFHRRVEAYYYVTSEDAPPNDANATVVLRMESLEKVDTVNRTRSLQRWITLHAGSHDATLDYNESQGRSGPVACRYIVNATRPGTTTTYRMDRPPTCWPDALVVP